MVLNALFGSFVATREGQRAGDEHLDFPLRRVADPDQRGLVFQLQRREAVAEYIRGERKEVLCLLPARERVDHRAALPASVWPWARLGIGG